MAKGSFSYVPGLLNANCVIHDGAASFTTLFHDSAAVYLPLQTWMDGSDFSRPDYFDDLKSCIGLAQPVEVAVKPAVGACSAYTTPADKAAPKGATCGFATV